MNNDERVSESFALTLSSTEGTIAREAEAVCAEAVCAEPGGMEPCDMEPVAMAWGSCLKAAVDESGVSCGAGAEIAALRARGSSQDGILSSSFSNSEVRGAAGNFAGAAGCAAMETGVAAGSVTGNGPESRVADGFAVCKLEGEAGRTPVPAISRILAPVSAVGLGTAGCSAAASGADFFVSGKSKEASCCWSRAFSAFRAAVGSSGEGLAAVGEGARGAVDWGARTTEEREDGVGSGARGRLRAEVSESTELEVVELTETLGLVGSGVTGAVCAGGAIVAATSAGARADFETGDGSAAGGNPAAEGETWEAGAGSLVSGAATLLEVL